MSEICSYPLISNPLSVSRQVADGNKLGVLNVYYDDIWNQISRYGK